jgi:hypothetical protein
MTPGSYITAARMRRISGIVLAALTLGALPTEALAASLRITVSPARVHPGDHYTVTITGSYTRRRHQPAPYLLAFIQYQPGKCQSSATGEYSLPKADWSWDFYPPGTVAASRFRRVVHWTARSRLGKRHVCAYLYANKISPGSTARPTVSASATFVDLKR